MAIQFTAVRIDDGPRPDHFKSEEMVLWGKILDRLWMAPFVEGKGSSGNMGFRIPHGICVTPSGSALRSLTVRDIMTVSRVEDAGRGVQVFFYGSHDKVPTSEALIYWDIFKKRKNVNVVLHGHDSICLEESAGVKKKFRGEVAMTQKISDAGSLEFRKDIKGILEGRASYLIGKGHGFFALGSTFEEAGLLALKFRTEAMKLLLGKQFIKRIKNKYDLL